jgi:hypothetical protein
MELQLTKQQLLLLTCNAASKLLHSHADACSVVLFAAWCV